MAFTNDIGIHEIDGLMVNEISHNVTIFGNSIELSPKEFDLLIYLLNNKNIVLSRENILSNVWGYDYYGDIRTVDTHIKSIRQKIKEKSDLIVTVRGSGYKLEVKM
jgi:two-component system, OmpR family, response regulator ResD